MRLLLDHECTAVAGGDVEQCVKDVTKAAIATGAVIGAVAGSSAGGVGCLPGAVAGAGVGSLVAQIVAEPLCKWANDEPQDPVDQEVQDWHDNQYGAWNASRVFPNQQHQGYFPTVYAPHEYVADGASY